ncbi:MAG TPA: M48 family metalloprotease [Terracidiphilus sp.]|nr:M48 family metalloprotease [Terracidiphilus sp.]
MKSRWICVSVFVLSIVCGFAHGQQSSATAGAAGSGCSIPEPPFRSNKPNIFSDQQEQWLGEAMAEQQEPTYDLLPDKDSAELERIGQKLLAQLPPTPIPYHFRVYESIEANGFSVAGGYVYISRKLITDARSEDEVAGVVSHEIGHIYTHQIAIALSRELKKLLNVTEVTTPEDVGDKLELLENAPWKNSARQSEDEQEKDEMLADRVGIYALIKAGYAPRAMSENLDRITANKGRTGNFLTDVLGGTDEISLRVRTTRKLAASLPGECGQRKPSASDSFKAFQQSLLDAPVRPLIEATPSLNAFKLQPPIGEHLRQVKFSPDGKWILAQTLSAVHVMSRGPLTYMFTVEARGADMALFSPDSQHLVFQYPSMRVEKWNVATGKREDFHEVIDYEGCQQTSLAPDGRTMVCLSLLDGGVRLKLIDVDTNKPFSDTKGFYVGGTAGQQGMIVRQGGGARVGSVAYSQDEKTMLIAAGSRAIAYDLASRSTISLDQELSKLVDGRLAFVNSKNLVYDCDFDYKAGTSRDTFKVCESTFPAGLPVNTFRIGYQWIEPVTNGAGVLIGPTKAAAALLVDPATGKASAGFKMDSVDMYGTAIASENERGGVSVNELAGGQGESAELPVGALYGVEAEFSPDGHFLAYSSKTRSAIWDLTTQKRVSLMRPFREAYFDSDGVLHAQYQPANQQPGANYQIDLKTGKSTEAAKFAIEQFQHEDVLVNYEALEKSGSTASNVNVHVADAATGKELWSRHYKNEAPDVEQVHDGTLLCSFEVSGDSGQDLIRHAGDKLVKTSDFRSQWAPRGWLVELVDSKTGATMKVVELPYLSGETTDSRWARVYGNTLVVHGSGNVSGIYRVSDGVRVGGFFGRVLTGDAKLGLLAISNHDQEMTILDAATGKRLKSVTLDQIPEAARFIPEKKELLVLTAGQTVTTLPVPDAGAEATK